jgi:hypothetical protein
MNEKKVLELYKKERDYERSTFGDYKDIEALSFPSFIILIKQYIEKVEKAYADKWSRQLPSWLMNCAEFEKSGTAPVEAYEQMIKLMALAGAALETYSEINIDKWREDPEIDRTKWIDEKN